MITIKKLAIYIFFSVIIISCKQEVKYDYYTSGKVSEKYYTDSNGIKQGEVVFFHENGTVSGKGFYVDGKLNGIVKQYYANGKLNSISTYINDSIFGNSMLYDDKGRLFQKGEFLMINLNNSIIKDLSETNLQNKVTYANQIVCYSVDGSSDKNGSWYFTIDFDGGNKIKFGDSLKVAIDLVEPYYDKSGYYTLYILQINDTSKIDVYKDVKLTSVVCHIDMPKKKGKQYLIGTIREFSRKNKSYRDFYFKREFVVE